MRSAAAQLLCHPHIASNGHFMGSVASRPWAQAIALRTPLAHALSCEKVTVMVMLQAKRLASAAE